MFPIETSHVEPFVTQIVYIIVGWGTIVGSGPLHCVIFFFSALPSRMFNFYYYFWQSKFKSDENYFFRAKNRFVC